MINLDSQKINNIWSINTFKIQYSRKPNIGFVSMLYYGMKLVNNIDDILCLERNSVQKEKHMLEPPLFQIHITPPT
jgi:hypothetical protein